METRIFNYLLIVFSLRKANQNIIELNTDLRNKNALVCGSSKGIGKAAAIALAELGANITLVSRSPEIMSDIIRELKTENDQDHDFLVADFTDSSDLKKKIIGLCSAKTIHILVNNTGGPPAGPIVDASEEEFMQAMHNHLVCNHLLAKAVLPGMEDARYGRIINIISTSVKQPIDQLGVSNTTRAAVANWAKTLSNEVAELGITVNNILPGATSTGRMDIIMESRMKKSGRTKAEEMEAYAMDIPMKRFARPEEIANAISFLASPAASYITGINLPVDGGRIKSL